MPDDPVYDQREALHEAQQHGKTTPTMRILHRGTPPGDERLRGTCTNCRTEVEFAPSEGQLSPDQRDGNMVSVTCPVCGGRIYSHMNARGTSDGYPYG